MTRRRIFSIHTLLTPGNRKRAAVFNRCDSDGQNTTAREYSTDRHPRLFDVLLDLERAHGSTFVYASPSLYGQPLLYVAIEIPGRYGSVRTWDDFSPRGNPQNIEAKKAVEEKRRARREYDEKMWAEITRRGLLFGLDDEEE